MIVTVAIILTLVPALLILWPFVMGLRRDEFEYDEGAPQADLMRRWDAAVAGLTSTELDHSLGNLSDEDYQGLRTRLLMEAADLMREMELSEEEEERMLANLSEEVRGARSRIEVGAETASEGEVTPDEPSLATPERSPGPYP